MENLVLVLPEIFISFSIMLLLILGVFKKNSSKFIQNISLLVLLITAVIIFNETLGIEEIILIETVLKEYGGKLFLVGGNVRDLILKNTDTSRSDLVCNLPINLIIRALTKKKIKISKVGIEYGSIIASVNKFSFDIT